MARITERKTEANRAAIYARVSDKSQDGEDKTSISEQIGEMEAYCESKGLTSCQGRSNLRPRGGAKVKLSQKSVAVEAIASSLNG